MQMCVKSEVTKSKVLPLDAITFILHLRYISKLSRTLDSEFICLVRDIAYFVVRIRSHYGETIYINYDYYFTIILYSYICTSTNVLVWVLL